MLGLLSPGSAEAGVR